MLPPGPVPGLPPAFPPRGELPGVSLPGVVRGVVPAGRRVSWRPGGRVPGLRFVLVITLFMALSPLAGPE
ncbi:hypothetical protein GCM10023080_045370 [Streptomyces pseudoechinosporeus]